MIRIAAFLLVFLGIGSAAAEPHFQVDRDTVIYEDHEAGEKIWVFHHKSLDVDDENQPEHPIRGPLQFEDRWYYSVNADLLEVDVDRKAIVGRTHYSMPIKDLKVSQGRLEVVATYEPDEDEAVAVTFEHHGESPGRGFWQQGILTSFRAERDVTQFLKEKKWESSAEDRASVAALLESGLERDRTNPFYHAYLGLFAHLDEDTETADAHFAAARAVDAPWFDRARVCGLLHRAARTEEARQTCSRALEQMKDEKIRPHAMYDLVTFVSVMRHHHEAMRDAIEASEYERVDAIAEDMYRIFPMVEASSQAWRVLADWFESEGKSDLAKKWKSRSVEIESSPITQAFWGGARRVDRALLVAVSIALLLPFAGLLIGFRTSRRKPDLEGGAKWIPRLSIAEGFSMVAILLLAFFSAHEAAQRITTIGQFASMPLPLSSEGYGSPDAIDWLEEQPENDARDRLLEYAKYESARAEKGQSIEKTPPQADILVEAVESGASQSVWSGFAESGSFQIFERASFGESRAPPTPPLGVPALVVFLFFLMVGAALSRVFPGFVRKAAYVVPGGSFNAGWATPWILGAFIAGGLWAFTPVGSILQTISTPSFWKFFGLDSIGGEAHISSPLDSWLPWALFAGAIFAHVVLVVFDRRDETPKRHSSR